MTSQSDIEKYSNYSSSGRPRSQTSNKLHVIYEFNSRACSTVVPSPVLPNYVSLRNLF